MVTLCTEPLMAAIAAHRWHCGSRRVFASSYKWSSRSEEQLGFVVLPRRWVVERTFAWLNLHRRLSKDYEVLTDNSEAMIYIAMTRLMLRRLKPL